MSKSALILLLSAYAANADEGMPDFSGLGGMGGGMGGMGGKGKSCPLYRCSKGFEPAPARPLKLSASGCSGMGGGMVMSMGQDSEGPVEDCCSRRSACFQTCGASKKTCEKEFEKCTKNACGVVFDPEEKKSCESSASLQVMMAGFGDCRDFESSQAASCQCMEASKAEKRREKILLDFYKKHAPEDAGKVEGLMKKSGGDPKKFAALLAKLVAKYPKAIKIKKSDQQDMMDKIMRESREKKEDADTEQEEAGEESGSGEMGDGGETVDDLDNLLKEEL